MKKNQSRVGRHRQRERERERENTVLLSKSSSFAPETAENRPPRRWQSGDDEWPIFPDEGLRSFGTHTARVAFCPGRSREDRRVYRYGRGKYMKTSRAASEKELYRRWERVYISMYIYVCL
jgi:hypothetical protein